MNEREKKLEKKDSWGYIINIIYKSQPQMHYLMYRRMEKADIQVDNTCCLIHLFFVHIKKIFKPLYCGIINILSGSIWMDFL